jgi:hypothetical protein
VQEYVIHGIHTLLDLIFLREEVRTHFFRFRKVVMSAIVSLVLLALLAIGTTAHTEKGAYEHTHGTHTPIETFIIGGILGCIVSHLRPTAKKSVT